MRLRENRPKSETRIVAAVTAVAAAITPVVGGSVVPSAAAWTDSVDSAFGARVQFQLRSAHDAPGFPWNAPSRFPPSSRVALDVDTSLPSVAAVYAKGVADWRDAAGERGRVLLDFEQGNIRREGRAGTWAFSARLFANERRFFTGESADPALDDDRILSHANVYALRLSGKSSRGEALVQTAFFDGWDDGRRFVHARMGRVGRSTGAWLSYLNASTGPGSDRIAATMRAEVFGAHGRLSLASAYEQTERSSRWLGMPAGDVRMDAFVGDNLSEILPPGASLFAEFRLSRVPFRDLGRVTFVHTYRMAGEAYANDLNRTTPGGSSRASALYFSAEDVALDAGLVHSRQTRWGNDPEQTETTALTTRAALRGGQTAVIRGVLSRTFDDAPSAQRRRFVHASLKQDGTKVTATLHALLGQFGDSFRESRVGVEARLNLTATVAIYGRAMSRQRSRSHDAVFWRIEMRPSERVLATFGYGRSRVGDHPYTIEDPDFLTLGDGEALYTLTLRGDL